MVSQVLLFFQFVFEELKARGKGFRHHYRAPGNGWRNTSTYERYFTIRGRVAKRKIARGAKGVSSARKKNRGNRKMALLTNRENCSFAHAQMRSSAEKKHLQSRKKKNPISRHDSLSLHSESCGVMNSQLNLQMTRDN